MLFPNSTIISKTRPGQEEPQFSSGPPLQCYKLTFSVGSKYFLPGISDIVAKLTYLVATISGRVTAQSPPLVRFMTQKKNPYGQRH